MPIIGPPSGGGGGPPTGAAGGVLAGEYPNPTLAAEAVKTAAIQLLAITAALIADETVTKSKLAKLLQEEIANLGTASNSGAVRANNAEWVPSEKLYVPIQFVATAKTTAAFEVVVKIDGKPATKIKLKLAVGEATPVGSVLVPPKSKVKLEYSPEVAVENVVGYELL